MLKIQFYTENWASLHSWNATWLFKNPFLGIENSWSYKFRIKKISVYKNSKYWKSVSFFWFICNRRILNLSFVGILRGVITVKKLLATKKWNNRADEKMSSTPYTIFIYSCSLFLDISTCLWLSSYLLYIVYFQISFCQNKFKIIGKI